MCKYSMDLTTRRPCRRSRWCQSCVRGWRQSFDHNQFPCKNPGFSGRKPGFLHRLSVRKTNEKPHRSTSFSGNGTLLLCWAFSRLERATRFPSSREEPDVERFTEIVEPMPLDYGERETCCLGAPRLLRSEQAACFFSQSLMYL